ncbi:acetyl-coenzyme A transporter 1-domain-containing protein [Lasiosphaeria ovina]|uniref:Acetyl-coenzyme A transporter 1-domain-containing protein n=1 Tax=Lasiosphaeria ovina TaxID=92902 RepID=A0AAE0N1U2_9PEZI|nr:acetyl-coenzyme A transporter 1-domain-containing protein [Lasiosphaeria ovina]
MGARSRRAKSPTQNGAKSPKHVPDGARTNGGASSSGNTHDHDPTMNKNVELLRRNISQDASSGAVTANLMSRETFSLDDPVPNPKMPTANHHGFLDLPKQDQKNFGLLVLLYFLQGIPLGLATGSVPFLLKNHMSYSEIGIFSLASYPYSLKLLWSPIVDAMWSPKVGRRKSWILPIQLLSGIGMLWLGSTVEEMMAMTGKPGGHTVWGFTGWWFFLVLMCATQDIAVDGWALTLLSPGNISYASTAQTVGLTAGQFLSHTVFLAFCSKDFANRWFRDSPLDTGLIGLGGYLTFWGWAYIAVTIGLGLIKKEEKTRNEDGIWDVYKIMWGVLKLRNIQTIVIVHLIAKIGFQANDGVTNLKLLDKGFGTDNMALTVLIDFPFEIGLGYYAGKWSQEFTPMRLWCGAFMGRLLAAVLAQITVAMFPAGGVTSWYLLVVIAEHIFSTFTNTVMFVSVSAFHARIADPVIGGTYMTLLATVCNLGGTFPRFFVLRLVDYFTSATCNPPSPSSSSSSKHPLVTEAFSCAIQADKERCLAGGGTCDMVRDGYYIVNVICVALGLVTFVLFIRPKVLQLQALPLRAWRLSPSSSSSSLKY